MNRVFVLSLILMILGGSLFRSAEAWGQISSAREQARNSVLRGDQLYIRGDLRPARSEYEKALRLFQEARDDLGVAECLALMGRVDLDLFQVDSARNLFERALAIRERNLPAHHADIAEGHQNLANLYFASGNFERAHFHYLQAIEIGRRTLDENSPDLATALRSLGQLAQMEGRNSEAESFYREALRMLEASRGRSHWRTAEARVVLAKHLAFEGDLETARKELEKGLRVLETTVGPLHLSTLGAQLATCTVARRQGDLQRAVELLVRMESGIQQAIPLGHPLRGEFLHEAALVMQDFGKGQEAESLLRRSLGIKIAAYGKNHPNSLLAMGDLTALLYVRGKEKEALQLLEDLHGRARQVLSPGSTAMASLLGDRSIILFEMGRIESALDSLELALASQDLVIRSLLEGTSERELRLLLDQHFLDEAISAHLHHAPASVRAGRLAFETVLRRKGLDVDVALRSHRRALRGDTSELRALSKASKALRDEQIRLWMGMPRQISETARLGRLEGLRREIDAKERQARLKVDVPRESSAITIEAIQAKLEPNQALLEIVNYAVIESSYLLDPLRIPETRYAAGILKARGEPTWMDLGPSSEIDELAIAFRESLLFDGGDYREAARRLYCRSFGKLEPLLRDIERLEISSTGAFQFIPLTALIDRGGRYLVERFLINHVSSGRDLLSGHEDSPEWNGALLVGGLDYGSGSHTLPSTSGDLDELSFSTLPATGPEIAGIRRTLGTGRILTGLEATESQVDGVRGPTILHLATHGFFRSERPLQSNLRSSSFVQRRDGSTDPLVGSGLALSRANTWQRASGADDGILTALEIRDLDLLGTELVVLSACETGLGEGAYNQGIYGMRRALSTAGARSQLLSLWTVSDTVTRHFMVSFYEQLKSGVDRTEALRRVQRAFAEGQPLPVTGFVPRGGEVLGGSSSTSHPFFWAGFVISGDRGPIPVPKIPESAEARNPPPASFEPEQ